jgi:hypothetical protein
MAALAADTLARRDLGDGYPMAAEGGLMVEGPYEVVLTGSAEAESIHWRPVAVGDDYALLMCLIRPARPRRALAPAVSTDLVDAPIQHWGWM